MSAKDKGAGAVVVLGPAAVAEGALDGCATACGPCWCADVGGYNTVGGIVFVGTGGLGKRGADDKSK